MKINLILFMILVLPHQAFGMYNIMEKEIGASKKVYKDVRPCVIAFQTKLSDSIHYHNCALFTGYWLAHSVKSVCSFNHEKSEYYAKIINLNDDNAHPIQEFSAEQAENLCQKLERQYWDTRKD